MLSIISNKTWYDVMNWLPFWLPFSGISQVYFMGILGIITRKVPAKPLSLIKTFWEKVVTSLSACPSNFVGVVKYRRSLYSCLSHTCQECFHGWPILPVDSPFICLPRAGSFSLLKGGTLVPRISSFQSHLELLDRHCSYFTPAVVLFWSISPSI